VAHAIAIDVHDDLQAAWQTLNATPDDDPRKAKMLELFDAMPPELTLTWPDAQLAAQWHEAIADPTHPRHEEAATHLESFVDGLYARWENDDQDLRDRLAWMRFFRKNYQAVVAMGK